VLLETGILPMVEPTTRLTLESPAGLITVECDCDDGKVTRVRFVNQPAFCYRLDTVITVPDIGTLTVDIAYGGMTYVLADVAQLGYKIHSAEARELCEVGQKIKKAAAEQITGSIPRTRRFPASRRCSSPGRCRRTATPSPLATR
jgi:proline racemase